MGVIKKKTATRGTEGGVKYVCDVCSADITSTVRIRCAHHICNEYDLCVPCFSNGETSHNHDPKSHPYSVIEQHSIPIFTKDWGADEELLLLEGAESYGLGSWADIADHIGGYRTKDEVRDHYYKTYVESSKFPLPERASPSDRALIEEIPREKFQARKKRRIEERKEAEKDAGKNLASAPPKQKPTASVPACHEVAGYMPGRLEFETEFVNEAEEAVQHMQFEPGEGINPRTGELEPEMELKMTVMDIYNTRLTTRAERKRVIFEHHLLEYRDNIKEDKKKTKEQRELLSKAKPFARMMNHSDFKEYCKGLEREYDLRQAIGQLQDWRQMRIGDLKAGTEYEQEKFQRAQRPPPTGAFDRLASNRISKPTPPVETASAASVFTAPDLPIRLQQQNGIYTPHASPNARSPLATNDKVLTNVHANGTLTPQSGKSRYVVQPLSNVPPLKLNNENATDLHLLTKEEQELCCVLRLYPKPYLVVKEHLMKEAMKQGGNLKRKTAREICKIDVNKGGRIFDFFVNSGWIGKA
ncbi:MAG: Transcriptional adapter ada2 [Candelina submexicana]|nr:MAG: Transcriptional adapter ada2 [Candelina submexicana]